MEGQEQPPGQLQGQQLGVPVSYSMNEIEERKSIYFHSRQMFFDRFRRGQQISEQHLQNLLDMGQWLLVRTYTQMNKEDKKENRRLYAYLVQLNVDKLPELVPTFAMELDSLEELIRPYVDVFTPEKIGIILQAKDYTP